MHSHKLSATSHLTFTSSESLKVQGAQPVPEAANTLWNVKEEVGFTFAYSTIVFFFYCSLLVSFYIFLLRRASACHGGNPQQHH